MPDAATFLLLDDFFTILADTLIDPMLSCEEAKKILGEAEQIFSADVVSRTVKHMAAEITVALSHRYPLVLSIMGGAVVFTGQLLP
ncbi:MAG: hypothetical protein ABI271_02170, partial [Nitrosospira sp.]